MATAPGDNRKSAEPFRRSSAGLRACYLWTGASTAAMRFDRVLTLLGVGFLVGGLCWSSYYLWTVYPAEEDKVLRNCETPTRVTGCATLSPAPDQPFFIVGEIVAGVGLVVLLSGTIHWIAGRRRKCPVHPG
jgi:hypothetical protein